MKALAIFLAALLVVFGLIAVAISLSRETSRVFVVVDSSFPMREVWRQVPGTLDELGDRDYAEYALATEKDLIHSWQGQLRFRATRPFAPCDFSEVTGYSEVAEADELVFITTSGSCPTDGLDGWTVILVEP